MSDTQEPVAAARALPRGTEPQLLPTEEELGTGLDLFALVGMAWRGKWILLAFAVVFGAVRWFYLNFMATALFTSTVRLDFQVRQERVVDVESVLSGVSRDQPAINTELEVIKSL